MKIYTLAGDDGSTSLSGGKRVPKHSLRVEAYGSVDELVAWFGLLWALKENSIRKNILIQIQDQLMSCASVLAAPEKTARPEHFHAEDCLTLVEKEIDKMEEGLPQLTSFVIPLGDIATSYCHIARCVCRRAERSVLRLKETEHVPDIIHKLLNRLSDYLFVLSRSIGQSSGYEEIKWPLRNVL